MCVFVFWKWLRLFLAGEAKSFWRHVCMHEGGREERMERQAVKTFKGGLGK